jgi:DeoR family transcriptional regulator of aga operon
VISVGKTRRAELIPAHRRALVLENIRLKGSASIQELAKSIGASASTIRRDLEELERKGYLERAHGGALLQRTTSPTFEPEADIAAEFSRAEKHAIGAAAAAMIAPGEAVIFDSGSTVMEAARAAVRRNLPLTAVTNDLAAGQVLAGADRIRVVMLGGTIRPGSLTVSGDPGQNFLKSLNANVALIGIHAVSGGFLTETTLEIASMKRAMIAAARRVILLADATKLTQSAFCRVCEVTAAHVLITDSRAGSADLDQLRDAGLEVHVVDVPADSG